jgi:hypothetical protein
MKKYLAAVSLACAMAALPLSAASPLGGVTVSGAVWTNQSALPSGSSLYAGDEIRTAHDAFAVLESPATGRLEVRGDTLATVGDGAVALDHGVVASQKLAVQLGDLEVTARDAQADNWFVVENHDGRKLIAAYRGDVVIRGGSAGSFIVPGGSYAMAAAAPAPRESADKDKDEKDKNDKRRAGGAAAGAGANTGWSVGSLGHAASVAVVTGATAAVMGGAVAAGAFRDDSASPQD